MRLIFVLFYVVDEVQINETGHLTAPSPRRRSSSTSEQSSQIKFDFEVTDCFMFGSPLALVLAYRKISATDDKSGTSLIHIDITCIETRRFVSICLSRYSVITQELLLFFSRGFLLHVATLTA